jgi:hypothetical protein
VICSNLHSSRRPSRYGAVEVRLADLIAAAGVNDYRSPLTTIERVGGG